MSAITYPFNLTPGTTNLSAQVNANFAAVAAIVNGQLDSTNLKLAAGITVNQLSLNPGGPAFNQSGSGIQTWGSGLTTDTIPRVTMTTDKGIEFGAGAASSLDTGLIRSAANTLQINDTTGGPGNLDLNGGTLLNTTISFSSITVSGTLSSGTNSGTGGQLTLFGSTSGNAVIKVNPAAGTTTFTLPVGNGAANEVLMTDGAGNTSWQQSFGRRFSAAITLAANQQHTVSNPLGAIPAMIWFVGICTVTFGGVNPGDSIYLYPSGDLTDTAHVNDCILAFSKSSGSLIQVDTGPQVSYGGTPIPFADFNWTMFVVG